MRTQDTSNLTAGGHHGTVGWCLAPLVLALVAVLGSPVVAQTPSNGPQPTLAEAWHWRDAEGDVLNKDDLDDRLKQREIDLSGADLRQADLRGRSLFRADLSGAQLNGADLSDANLEGADLSEAILWGVALRRATLQGAKLRAADLRSADLTGADLSEVDLSEAELVSAKLSGAVLGGAILREALLVHTDLRGAVLRGATFVDADLRSAVLTEADLTGADLRGANLQRADLSRAVLTGASLVHSSLDGATLEGARLQLVVATQASLVGSNLSGADLGRSDLSGVVLRGADLREAVYEPAEPPTLGQIAAAHNLTRLSYADDPVPLSNLRTELSEGGYRRAERQVSAALRRRDAHAWESLLYGWTCDFGADAARPLWMAAGLWLGCTVLYWLSLHGRGSSGLYLVTSGKRIAVPGVRQRVFRLRIEPPPPGPWFRRIVKGVKKELSAISTGALFSLMSAFNLSFRDLDFGRWIRMMTAREFDLRSRGWTRTVSGFQSLATLVLVALSAISYLGGFTEGS